MPSDGLSVIVIGAPESGAIRRHGRLLNKNRRKSYERRKIGSFSEFLELTVGTSKVLLMVVGFEFIRFLIGISFVAILNTRVKN